MPILKTLIKHKINEISDKINTDETTFTNIRLSAAYSNGQFSTKSGINYSVDIFFSSKSINPEIYNIIDNDILNKIFSITKVLPTVEFRANGSHEATNGFEQFEVAANVFGFLKIYTNRFKPDIINFYTNDTRRANFYMLILRKHFDDYFVLETGTNSYFIIKNKFKNLFYKK
jgi:hypothetical protein